MDFQGQQGGQQSGGRACFSFSGIPEQDAVVCTPTYFKRPKIVIRATLMASLTGHTQFLIGGLHPSHPSSPGPILNVVNMYEQAQGAGAFPRSSYFHFPTFSVLIWYMCGARDCPNRGAAKCYNCGNEGHMSRDCPEGPKDTKTCYRCGQAGHISRDCPSSGGAPGGGQSGAECYKCGEVGHIARNCPKSSYNNSYGGSSGGYGSYGGAAKTCYSCGGVGHMSRDCVNGSKCYNCGETGHFSRDCPKASTSGEKICYKCQQPGHIQADCPNN
ncbi:cellular nucleic acid-binding protein [Sporothrix schenckii 1099-18]|uniref:Cellular nucleic acid-binding protein n=1 Tax=Sporothrix schenckii 1099-18 TaxID=1397361 RepID=A0A0F2M196_SPOSC|nr:cellular nucleic acid-binding protein [Sporothrix schenckii 1099-18]KJR82879.1 cellular nucleic acid-binding protein [Sporothrix schenckii 1099-18]